MNILVVNDDGIFAPGLSALAEKLSERADVYVVAPMNQCSAFSHHMTLRGRMRIHEEILPYAKKAYALEGTPVDCCHSAIKFLFRDQIDFVVSGINQGANLGSDIIYSGTVAGAREAFIHEIPSLAVSLDSVTSHDFLLAAECASKAIDVFLKDPYRTEYFLNINVPALSKKEIKGVKICDRIGRIDYDENYFLTEEETGYYLNLGNSDVTSLFDERDERIDSNALKAGYITISPLFNNEINPQAVRKMRQDWSDIL